MPPRRERAVVRALLLGLLVLATLSPARVLAQRVRVRVVDVAGGRAYVSPGATEGIVRGVRLRFGRRSYEVVGGTSEYAVVDMGDHPLRVGARGTGRAMAEEEIEEARRLPPPEPLESYRARWTPAARPSASQNPAHVPLSGGASSRRVALTLSSSTGAILPFDGSPALLRTQLRGRLRARLTADAPLHLHADAALQLYFGSQLDARRGDRSRPVAVVRQLQLSYGEDRSFYAALGRLRRASSSIGVLDGARVETPTFGGGFRVAAFGGVVPDPDAGIPNFDAARFGLELLYANPELPARPSASLVAHGSTFGGTLDEKRLSARVRLMPGDFNLGGYAEASFFSDDNPLGAPTAQLSVAGIDLSGRHGGFRWGVRGDYRVPMRSLWLMSFLPPGYLCVGQAEDTDPASTACSLASDARYSAGGDVEMRWTKFALGATASYMRAPEAQAEQLVLIGHARAVDIAGFLRLRASLSATRGSLMDAYSARLGLGAALLRGKLDVGIHYRPTLRLYSADIVSGWDHRVGVRLFASWSPEWQIGLSSDALLGRDVQAMLAQLHLVWQPRIGG